MLLNSLQGKSIGNDGALQNCINGVYGKRMAAESIKQ